MTFSNPYLPPVLDLRRHLADVLEHGPETEFEILADYVVEFDWTDTPEGVEPGRYRLTAPAGTKAAPSIPVDMTVGDKLPPLGGILEASMIHDHTYGKRCFDPYAPDRWGKDLADELFGVLMEASKTGGVNIRNVLRGVYMGGGGRYEACTFQPGFGPVRIGDAT